MKTSKIVSIIVLLVLLAATVAGAYLGLFGRNTQYVTIRENGEDVERALYRQVAFIPNTLNRNWQEAIRPSSALGGGFSYTFSAEQGDLSEADFNKALRAAAKVAAARTKLLTGNAMATVKDGQIVLSVNETAYNTAVEMVTANKGLVALSFYNAETGLFTDALSAEHIQQAFYAPSQNALAGTTTYQIQLQLTAKGAKAYNALVADHLGETIYLNMDGGAAASAYVSTEANNNLLLLNAQDGDTAFLVVDAIRGGMLPLSLTLVDAAASEASMGGFLDGAIVGFAVALLLCCLYLLVTSRLGGLVGVLTLAAQLVLYWLLAALISVSSLWTMDLFSMIVLMVVEAAFVFGLVTLLCAMAKAVRQDMGAHAALKAAYKQHQMMLLLVHGALLVIGLVLMFAFTAGMYGVLGRLIALSAAVSLVMLFVFLRVAMNCVFSAVSAKRTLYGAAK